MQGLLCLQCTGNGVPCHVGFCGLSHAFVVVVICFLVSLGSVFCFCLQAGVTWLKCFANDFVSGIGGALCVPLVLPFVALGFAVGVIVLSC